MQTLAKPTCRRCCLCLQGDSVNFNWAPSWLPQGFSEVSSSRRQLPTIDMPVESRLYSDGLFSFSVNINRAIRTVQRSDVAYRTPDREHHGA
jgi:sigma-E factor negative regulatory protein RseB